MKEPLRSDPGLNAAAKHAGTRSNAMEFVRYGRPVCPLPIFNVSIVVERLSISRRGLLVWRRRNPSMWYGRQYSMSFSVNAGSIEIETFPALLLHKVQLEARAPYLMQAKGHSNSVAMNPSENSRLCFFS